MEYDYRFLRRMREVAGITQTDLAEKTGISRSHLNDIEKGRAIPTTEVAERLAQVLTIPLRGFYRFKESVI